MAAEAAARRRLSVVSRPSSSMLSNRPGRDLRAGDRDADRLERLPRLQAEPVRGRSQRLLDRLRFERLEHGQRLVGRREHRPAALEIGRVGLDVAEEETREVGELGQPRDLLLHERSRVA